MRLENQYENVYLCIKRRPRDPDASGREERFVVNATVSSTCRLLNSARPFCLLFWAMPKSTVEENRKILLCDIRMFRRFLVVCLFGVAGLIGTTFAAT